VYKYSTLSWAVWVTSVIARHTPTTRVPAKVIVGLHDNATTLSIMTFSIASVSTKANLCLSAYMALSITTLCHFVDGQYVQYHVLFLVILSDVMQCHYAECRYAEYRYPECLGANSKARTSISDKPL
jgi:hypothetical protein